ncbi:myosin-11-like [Bombus pascuorum]|uniref:myosin-11-like n=1 Tax=Bombus pascuorum TaxID=65598 RepID=UPI00298E9310|nr:myosin-11-like [Bombus pascuorum]
MGSALIVRNQRAETKKNEATSLESLRETILELKKSLNETEKKRRENSKNLDTWSVKEKQSNKQEQKKRTAAGRNNYEKSENDDERNFGWWENLGAERLNLKKREPSTEDLDEKNAHLKVWRTKRTGVNNDDGNPKLFHRAGFGDPYLEEDTLKELHDRKRRSKGTPSDEKRHLNEAQDGNKSAADEKNSIKISKTSGCGDADASVKIESLSNDLQARNAFERESELTNNPTDTAASDVSKAAMGESKNTETGGNCEQSDLSRENQNAMENKLMKNKEKGESPEGNSLQTFESTTNELQAASSTETSNQENVGSSKGEQVIKVFEPQRHLRENSERTKEVEETDDEHEELSPQVKRSAKDSGNINILVKSENKNLIEFSNADGDKKLANGGQSPFVLNIVDVKKKTIVEDEQKAGKSVSMLYNMKLHKSQVDKPVEGANKRDAEARNDEVPVGSVVLDFRKNKLKEVPYEDTPASTNTMKERNVDEKRLENSADLDKGSEQSGVNEEGTRNWFGEAARNQMAMNVDHGAAEKCNDLGGKDKFTNAEGRFNDNKEKGDSVQGSNKEAEPNRENKEGRNKKYREIFIMTNGIDDRIMNDKYGQRRILQYMEYSNDDVEDTDVNYSDKEEEENQHQAAAEKSDAATRRKERAAYSDRKKDKVNLLIKEKIDKKKKPRQRKRRNPSVIEYYDYDSNLEQQDHESLSPTSEQQRSKNNYQDKSAIEFDAGPGNHACTSPSKN